GSQLGTKQLIAKIEAFKPDLIHLHNLHGCYVNLRMLFRYLAKADIPVVWTLHDCWPFTGHCAYFDYAKCEKWQTICHHCPQQGSYPICLGMDGSKRNYAHKKKLFTSLRHLTFVAPCEWMKQPLSHSFLGSHPVRVIPNGVNRQMFHPIEKSMLRERFHLQNKQIVLSVASEWDERKGLDDLVDLAEALGSSYCVVAVGLDEYQINSLPAMGSGKAAVKPLGLLRTGNVKELCALYTAAELYMCPSHEESMGMTLVEALACGTQVLCYQATAMPEIVTPEVGEVVPLGDIEAAAEAVRRMCAAPKSAQDCRARAAEFDSTQRFAAYMRLYENMYRYSPAYQQMLETAKGPQSAAAGKTKSEVESSSFDPHDS
ncbi:MAG: glycosyltransferase, partial [Clostridia bacterium]